jgi:hypothetical protein
MSIFSAACEHGYLIISAIKLFIGVRGIFFNCTYAVGTMYSGRGWHHVLRLAGSAVVWSGSLCF